MAGMRATQMIVGDLLDDPFWDSLLDLQDLQENTYEYNIDRFNDCSSMLHTCSSFVPYFIQDNYKLMLRTAEQRIKELRLKAAMLGIDIELAADNLPKLTVSNYQPHTMNDGDIWFNPAEEGVTMSLVQGELLVVPNQHIFLLSGSYDQSAEWGREQGLRYKKHWTHINSKQNLLGRSGFIIKHGNWGNVPVHLRASIELMIASSLHFTELDGRSPMSVMHQLEYLLENQR